MGSTCPPVTERSTSIRTHSGLKFNYVRDYWEHDDICIADIAVGLSRMPRFCGQTIMKSTVAQHSVHTKEHVERYCGGSRKTQLIALLHDAMEAYVCDVPSPFKKLMPEYKAIEMSIWARISHKYFGEVIDPLPKMVKKADAALLDAERLDSFEGSCEWNDEVGPRSPIIIVPWSEEYARMRFLQVFEELSDVAKCHH